jgi:hypothetical protein
MLTGPDDTQHDRVDGPGDAHTRDRHQMTAATVSPWLCPVSGRVTRTAVPPRLHPVALDIRAEMYSKSASVGLSF